MDSGTLSIMINLISGAVGGNVAGGVMKGKSLGTLGNSVAGILGGGVGGQILHALGVSVAHGGTDLCLHPGRHRQRWRGGRGGAAGGRPDQEPAGQESSSPPHRYCVSL
jgi:uncharacterized membrane protein YeaQ/YmgE (transglycosylase-associated protein family)